MLARTVSRSSELRDSWIHRQTNMHAKGDPQHNQTHTVYRTSVLRDSWIHRQAHTHTYMLQEAPQHMVSTDPLCSGSSRCIYTGTHIQGLAQTIHTYIYTVYVRNFGSKITIHHNNCETVCCSFTSHSAKDQMSMHSAIDQMSVQIDQMPMHIRFATCASISLLPCCIILPNNSKMQWGAFKLYRVCVSQHCQSALSVSTVQSACQSALSVSTVSQSAVHSACQSALSLSTVHSACQSALSVSQLHTVHVSQLARLVSILRAPLQALAA
jgi:hypothetical protein